MIHYLFIKLFISLKNILFIYSIKNDFKWTSNISWEWHKNIFMRVLVSLFTEMPFIL